MGTRIATSIDMTGPFFVGDPVKKWRVNVKDFMDAVAREGEEDVKVQLRQGESRRAPVSRITPARVSAHVRGRTSALTGKRWGQTAVVSVNNSGFSRAEGIALMAAASEIEQREHVFRRTTQRLRRARKANEAALLKGLT